MGTMLKQTIGLVFCIAAFALNAVGQTTNIFPANGGVGIGTIKPSANLDVTGTQTYQNPTAGDYLLNYSLGNGSEDPDSGDIILLVPASSGSAVNGSQFDGIIKSNRGSSSAWNMNSEWYVSVQGAYTNNTGSILPLSGQQEYTNAPILVTCVYNGTTYIGFQTPANSLSTWSLTGNWSNNQNSQKPLLVSHSSVTNISTLVGYESLGSQISATGIGNTALVGIGTITPLYTLDVAGQIHSSKGVVFPDGTSQTTAYNQVSSGSNVITQSSGDVGIGTTTPAAKLDVADTSGGGALETVLARLSEGNTTGDGTYLGVRGWNTQPSPSLSFSIEHHFYGQTNSSINFYRGGGTTGGFLTFATNSNNERMRIDPSGNVGIGTTSPGAKLEVNGTAQIDGNLQLNGTNVGIVFPTNGAYPGGTQTVAYTGVTCGGDYAESVDVAGDRKSYEPGDVLVIGAESGSDVLKSAEPYSTLVAGIYSTKPGTVGRRQTTDSKTSSTEVPMAMVGIVPIKVSAENGSIKRGDLLVTSSTLGHAMKGTNRSKMLGAVVGKALGNLDSGTGVIEVLVTLQ